MLTIARKELAVFALAIVVSVSDCHAQSFAKLSPFTGVRWDDSQPVVRVDNEWFKLVSINKITAEDMVAFSKRTFGNQWQMRFEEDLVELLAGMGHEPKQTVQLVIIPVVGESEPQTLTGVSMTRENRESIRDARLEREQQGLATHPAVSIDDEQRFCASIDKFLKAARMKTGFSGVVAVARGDRTVYQGAVGFSQLKSRAENTLDTPFRIASLSKQFTSAAVFRLASEGKLSIDDPVHLHLAEFADEPYREITIHHLLTHTSGLPKSPESLLGGLRWSRMARAETPVGDYVRLAVQMPLKSKPGTKYEYSNFGYRVLSALIARVSGHEYADFMQQEVFGPLKMNNTGVARVTRPDSETHVAEGLSLVTIESEGPVYKHGERGRNFGTGYGSGGIYSSVNDLVLWDRALRGNEFLSEHYKSRLFQPIHDDYACGWKVKKSSLDGRVYHSHSGSNQGFHSEMMRIPDDKMVIVVVGNVDATTDIDGVVKQLFRLCRSLPYRTP